MSEEERFYHHSHGEALRLVKDICPKHTITAQLAILEKACVLQNIKNVFDSFAPSDPRAWEYAPGFYAFYSLSDDPGVAEDAIPLMIFDPRRLAFVGPFASNAGLRLADLHQNAAALAPFKITYPPDLAAIIAAEAAQVVEEAQSLRQRA